MIPWLLAARPKTLPAAIVPVWLGTVLAWKLTGTWHPFLCFCTLAGAVCIQIATNLFNDAIDDAKGSDTDARLGPKRVTASGILPRRSVYIAASVFLIFAIACGVPLYRAVGFPIIAIGIPSLYLAYGYTGGVYPLAYRGMGELFVILFFGIIAVTGTVLIQTGEWRQEAFLLGWQVGLLSAVLISINNLRDREEDSQTGKRTLAVRLGEKPARYLVWIEMKVAIFSGLFWLKFQQPEFLFAVLPLLTVGGFLLWKVLTMPVGKGMNRLLALSAGVLVLFAICFQLVAVIVP